MKFQFQCLFIILILYSVFCKNVIYMLNTIFNQKFLNLLIAIIVAIFTAGYLRVHFVTFFPEPDGGLYTYLVQEIHAALSNGKNIPSNMPLAIYPLITSWVFSLEINQYIALRWIDLLVAIAASFLFYKIILKESGSTIFTILFAGSALLVMNDKDFILYGFRNSIWASYVPLFGALLIWQSISKVENYKFYYIGALVAFGILLREPFLPFFILGGVSIFIAYGQTSFYRYIAGAALLGFISLGFLFFFREGGLSELINSYIDWGNHANRLERHFIDSSLRVFKVFWFGIFIAIIFIFYAIKLFWHNKNSVSINRFLFWGSLALIPIIEPLLKYPVPYHFLNCIPGLVGFSALGWRHLSLNESKKTKRYNMLIIILICIYGIYPNLSASLNSKYFKDSKASVSYAYDTLWVDIYSDEEQIKWSLHLKIADVIRKASKKDSTLGVLNSSHALYPITGLRPPIFTGSNTMLNSILSEKEEGKAIDMLKKYQPTIISTIMYKNLGEEKPERFASTIEKTNLYEKIYSGNAANIMMGDIYRLKNFKSN